MVEERRHLSKQTDVPRFTRALHALLRTRYPQVKVETRNGQVLIQGGKATVRRIHYFVQGYRAGWLDNEATDP